MESLTTIFYYDKNKKRFNPQIDKMGRIIDRSVPLLKYIKRDITGRMSFRLQYNKDFGVNITYYDSSLIVHDNGYINNLMSTSSDPKSYTQAIVDIYNKKAKYHINVTDKDTHKKQITYMKLDRFSDEKIVYFINFIRWAIK